VLAGGDADARTKMRHPSMCFEPVEWVGRWRFLKGWTKVWSCERHADELPWARRWV
jgi:hypothetical protein